ncbi:uncharacterized protein F5891DRAFT_988155 [Suillus fuscotomentosus]|uniref:DUF6532 domain-containing protein n=1 Tax=Suillus fuscotomentosus TaxID=1912939 RepID=A0AAD4HBC0_9AGAM|nr:uncharacterized protein F5891DRAFT_988155 [Suillus fuscotomentosus]KAG1887502.1 hypothetical protein F5891DRAFT_988155 [Suillus fuscotomentosus]
MPPRAIASPKKKRSGKRKGSDASKASLPKKSRAADIAEVPSTVPLVSLSLTGAEAEQNAPRHSGRPNAGTGGRNAQLEKIGSVLQSKPRTQERKGTTSLGLNVPVNPQAPEPHRRGRKNHSKAVPPPYSSLVRDAPDAPAKDIIATGPSFTSQQPGGRFGFVAPTEIAHSGTAQPNIQALHNPHVTIGAKDAEQRARDAIAEQRARDAIAEQRARDAIAKQQARDTIAEQRARDAIAEKRTRDAIAEQHTQNAVSEYPVVLPRSIFQEENLDPALRQHDDTVRAQRHLTSFESDDSDSKDCSSDDSNDSNDKDADEEDSGEDDEEEGGNDDTVKSSQQFGWGEAGRRQKEHPGFVEDVPPSQSPVARPLTPEIQFQYSHDEDDVVAQTSLDKTSRNESFQDPLDISPGPRRQASQHIETITSKPDDVLQCHHKKNGKPHLPDPESLELLNQVSECDVQPLKNKKSRSSRGGPTPDQLSWYRPRWKFFLEDAKVECRAQHALENPFPTLVKNLPGTITEVLIAVLVVWDTNGKQFEAGVWPEQKFNMTRLSVLKLYDDLSTWRSDLKKTAISIAPVSYSLIPPLSVPIQERAAWVEHTAAELIKEAFFLRFGVDDQGRTRNFAHPALREAVITFFYTGPYRIARRMPETFSTELPLSCLALVAAAFNCVFDGLVKNGHGKSYPNFSTKDYGPVYCRMLKLLKHILEDAYHGPRLSAQLREWAAAGWAAAMNLEGVVDARHDHLQILLD